MSDRMRELCSKHGLRYTTSAELSITRQRCGKGFTYRDADGGIIRDDGLVSRLRALVLPLLPPAWEDVRIAEHRDSHLQAVGRDVAGRVQYRYHERWSEARGEAKGLRVLLFGAALPKIREAVERDLRQMGDSRRRAVAAVVRLIDKTLVRAGNCRYARDGGGRGAATLTPADVKISGRKVVLDFFGKGGKRITHAFVDPLLASVLERLKRRRGERLFETPDEDGEARPVTAREVNDYLNEVSGTSVSAKDFRTFGASARALASLLSRDRTTSKTKRTRAINEAIDEASEALVNTRAICKSSYVCPDIVEAYDEGKLEPQALRGKLRVQLDKRESVLMRFLERATRRTAGVRRAFRRRGRAAA